jgi:hypothetical protein
MSTLDSTISSAILFQDIELATAIKQLKSSPSELQSFLQTQQDNVYKKITNQKDDTFQKVYGDMNRSQNVQGSILRYQERSKELSSLQDTIFNNQKGEADAIVENKNTFGRKYEMNEWSVGNKQDTLFVFSALFIVLSVCLLCTGLLRINMISSSVWACTCVIFILVFVLIIVNRSQYTNLLRNKRYWNKKNFDKVKTPIISVCPPTSPSAPVISSPA